tara:strand:- start:9390 stop:9752 length:363 start_codon:yes stop_codon:yes gene_type:complete
MKSFALTLICLLTAGTALAQDCTAPAEPKIPDGSSADMQQMLDGQQAVKAFQAANSEYMDCLDPKIAEATEKVTAEDASEADLSTLKSLEEAYNAAVSREENVAEEFNSEIRDYKEANPG